MSGVSKRYGGVHALDNVDFACRTGSIHAVLGENGAGKSTLIKIASGVVQRDTGSMALAGEEVNFTRPSQANAKGVVCIFQELSLLPDLSVADNIAIADPPRWLKVGRFGLIDRKAQRARAEAVLASIGCEDIDPRSMVRELPLSRRQMVEIGKALSKQPKLLILDEATSALTQADVEKVYAMLAKLKAQGLSILYISHRMHEIEALADRASVFRNGRHIETFDMGAKTKSEIVQQMIGREISSHFPPKAERAAPAPVLEVKNLAWESRLNGVSLSVGMGEIVGLGGLDGQGQKELLLALFGVLRGVRGEVLVDGKPARLHSPAAAKRPDMGIALIPEDRKTEGLMLPMSIGHNLAIASLSGLRRGPFVDKAKEAKVIADAIERLKIKIGASTDAVSTLSGGNQQKVVIAKWLMTNPRIILLNDPTRGIDVGTKQEIYRLLRQLADAGAAILFYSTDYEELTGCCNRVSVMVGGKVSRELEGADITEMNIVASAFAMEAAHEHASRGAAA